MIKPTTAIVLAAFVTLGIAAVIGCSNGDESRDEVAALREEVSQLREEVESLKSKQQVDVGDLAGDIHWSLSTLSHTEEALGQNPLPFRPYSASLSYESKIDLAQLLLQEGLTNEAKGLILVALSDLGLRWCEPNAVYISPRLLPEELIDLIREDIAPQYSIELLPPETYQGQVVSQWLKITYHPSNSGC